MLDISNQTEYSEGGQYECAEKPTDKIKMGVKNICPATCTYANTCSFKFADHSVRHSAACSVSILIEAGLQSLRIRVNPHCLLHIIQINLAMLWVELQMISLVEQSLHNMHMYSMLETRNALFHFESLSGKNAANGHSFIFDFLHSELLTCE